MTKVNIGLMGILIIIILIFGSIFYLNSKTEKLYEELVLIKIFLENIDNDIHKIEEKLKK